MRKTGRLALSLAMIGLGWPPSPALPAHPQCSLALVLAMDASVSIKEDQHRLIRGGTADALRQPAVASAFAAGNVMLMITEYSDRVAVIVDWTPILTPADLDAVALKLETTPRTRTIGTSTGMGIAMLAARNAFDGPRCDRNVLDILTDGESNVGLLPKKARAEFRDGIDQINVLFVGDNPAFLIRMEEGVKFGAMAFVMPVPDFESVGRAMYRKLLMEVAMVLDNDGTDGQGNH